MLPRSRRRSVGVEVLPGGTVHARVWAPTSVAVTAILEAGPGTIDGTPVSVVLNAEERGYFSGILPGAAAGTHYRFRLDEAAILPDPASRLQPHDVHGASEIVDPTSFTWQVDRWSLPPFEQSVIYELHVGTFTSQGTFAAIIPHLPYFKNLGVTTLELMPIAQFPGERNWGYDGVFPYAAQDSYGGPDGLRQLVDACHAQDLGVILDVVYNHFGPEGNVLPQFGPYFTDRYRTPWGDAINFDGQDSDEVRHFFIESALMWLEECRIDGFRLDAVHQIFDAHAQPFLAELGEAVHRRAEELGRRVVLVAESDLNDPKLILPHEFGGYALDAQWADDFCHSLEVQLVGEKSAYADDYGEFAQLGKALREAFVYTGEYSPSRRRRFGRSPAPARRDQFVVFNQNHDQVGNRPGGERLGHHLSLAQRKLAAATVLLSSFVPLLFMGEEYDEPHPFLYFTEHGDPDLVEAVRAGRQAEFPAWEWGEAAPDPQDVNTFERSKLDLALHEQGDHRSLHTFYRELLLWRRRLPVLTDPTACRDVSLWENERIIMLRARRDDESMDDVVAVLSFADTEQQLTLPLPAGDWLKRLDASEPRFLGDVETAPASLSSPGKLDLTLPPYTVLLFTRTQA